MKQKLESRFLREISITSDAQMTPPLTAESNEELKSLLIWVKRRMKKLAETQHSKNEDYGIWPHYFMAKRWVNSGDSG